MRGAYLKSIDESGWFYLYSPRPQMTNLPKIKHTAPSLIRNTHTHTHTHLQRGKMEETSEKPTEERPINRSIDHNSLH